MRNPGFTVTFDSKGGSDVPAQNQMYGALLEVPEPPTREGYSFTGWYTDSACDLLWQTDTDTIQTDDPVRGMEKAPIVCIPEPPASTDGSFSCTHY